VHVDEDDGDVLVAGLAGIWPIGWGQGSKFRSVFGEISVFFPFSLDTGNRNFGRFRDFSFRNLKIQKNLYKNM